MISCRLRQLSDDKRLMRNVSRSSQNRRNIQDIIVNKSSSFDNTQLQNQQAKQMLLVQKSIILKAMNEFGLGNAWT